jgi:hypothetical protein
MPGFGFRLPRFLRSHRSSRSHSSSANPRKDTAAAQSANLSPSPALSSCPSARQGALEQYTNTATATAYSSALGSPQSPGLLGVGTPLGDSSGQPSPVSQPVTSISTSSFSPPDLVAQPPVCAGSTQFQHPSCSLLTPSQQSLVIERPNVSLSFIFPSRMMMLNHSKPLSAKDLTPSPHQSQGIFKNAQNFSIVGSSLIDNIGSSESCPCCELVSRY